MRIEAVQGDITDERTDALVNAADPSLLGGGGVDGAIHAAAGPELLAECRRLRRTTLPGGLPAGAAVATGAGRLPVRCVIHTVGPNRHAGQTDPAVLARCFTASLDVAAATGARSVAVPAVGAGAFGWDVAEVARVAVGAVRGWVRDHGGADVHLVRFVLVSPAAFDAFASALGVPSGGPAAERSGDPSGAPPGERSGDTAGLPRPDGDRRGDRHACGEHGRSGPTLAVSLDNTQT